MSIQWEESLKRIERKRDDRIFNGFTFDQIPQNEV